MLRRLPKLPVFLIFGAVALVACGESGGGGVAPGDAAGGDPGPGFDAGLQTDKATMNDPGRGQDPGYVFDRGFDPGGAGGGDGGPVEPTGPSCETYCDLQVRCTGEHAQYAGIEDCMETCKDLAAWPRGTYGDSQVNTVGCRLGHMQLLEYGGDPAQHCGAAGPTGGGICGSWCENYCDLGIRHCTGSQTLFSGMVDCLLACENVEIGGPASATEGDNLPCRIRQLILAGRDPHGGSSVAHCPSGSLLGGPPCIGAPGVGCPAAIVIDELPFEGQGDTSESEALYGVPSDSCKNDHSAAGSASKEHVYKLTPNRDGIHTIKLDAEFSDIVYVATDCENLGATCVGISSGWGSTELKVRLEPDETYFIFVDGASNSLEASGPYTLTVEEPCAPDCTGRICGDNGCGGSCGQCEVEGEICGTDGQCKSASEVVGNTCANPQDVTEAPYEIRATTRDATNDFSAPEGACEGFTNEKGTGSNDHVYRFTPPVAGVYTVKTDSRFDSATYIVSDCSSVAASCVIGDDSWTGEFKVNLSPPGPYYIIVDGHSITSNVRGSYTLTISEPCMPECAGKQCGPDGCGAACGQCAEAELCGDDGQCYPPESVPGNTCANAFDVTSIPFEKAGDSKIGTNLYQTAIGSCPPDGEGVGAKSPDHVFRFTPTVSGTYKITLENESWNGTFYVSTDCSNISGTCAYEAADSFYMDEVADVTLFSGQTYFIIVDGESSSVSSGGEYVLKIDEPCIQQCAGKQCGDDGCGASCGTCPGEQLCTEEGQCVDREAIPGNTCGEAFTVGPLPFTGTGDTSVGEDVYSFPQNACPQSYSGKGAASRDHVYLFNPPADGDYEIKLDATFDSALYVATDCAQIDKTCLAGADVSGPETLVLNLNAGITFYIFVDGWSNSTDLHGSYTLTVKKR